MIVFPPSTRVACLGECMIELRERPDGLLSRAFGGDTLNTAVYLARLGAAVDYLTALGADAFSDAMIAAWAAEGVGTDSVLRVPGRLPGLYLIQTDARGERRFSHWRDAAPVRDLFRLPEFDRVEAALGGYGLLYLSGITLSLFGKADQARLFALLDRLRAAGGRVAFDTNFRPRGWPDRVAALAAYAAIVARSDILFVSAEDVALLTGAEALDERALRDWLGEAATREVVLRFAHLDCRVLVDGATVAVPCHPAETVVDTTAAGDSFAAAYLAARLRGEPPAAAAAAGHALAHVVIQHAGAIIPKAEMGSAAAAVLAVRG